LKRTIAEDMVVDTLRRCVLHVVVLSTALLAGCASFSTAPNSAAAQALAPTGKLRVGLYPGTPTSILGDPTSGNAKGVGFDLGRALAQQAGVAFDPVLFTKNAEVLAAAKAGSVDMVFTNATPARRNDLDFSPAVLQVEQGYLVPARSPIRALDQIDRAGVRVGVSEGSTSEATLSREFRNATVVRTPSLKAAIDMLAAAKLEALPRTRPRCSRYRTNCPARVCLTAVGGWRASQSAFRRGARRHCPSSAASSPKPRPTARWREPSSERDCGERCRRISGVSGTAGNAVQLPQSRASSGRVVIPAISSMRSRRRASALQNSS
jgi:polar amino acid transport system substrate-binding protein